MKLMIILLILVSVSVCGADTLPYIETDTQIIIVDTGVYYINLDFDNLIIEYMAVNIDCISCTDFIIKHNFNNTCDDPVITKEKE